MVSFFLWMGGVFALAGWWAHERTVVCMKRVGTRLPVLRRIAVFFGRRVLILFFGLAGFGAGGAVLADDFSDGMAFYQDGRYEEAFDLVKKAAEADNSEAQYRLSSMYWHGQGVTADYEQAFLWCRRAAFKDHVKAAYALSDMYRKGVVEQDSSQAYYWFRRAAELDMENGRLAMALMYYRGTLVEKNVEQAFRWFQQAAEDGNVTAMTMLGLMYEDGEHVERDEAHALALFTKAAKKEVDGLVYHDSALESRAEARYHLARMIERGQGGVAADIEVARQWYRKAASDGNRHARAWLDADGGGFGKD